MDFDLKNVLVMVLTSIIGMGYIRHGKRTAIIRFIVFGVILMTYSYFTPSFIWTLGVGVLLCAGPFLPI